MRLDNNKLSHWFLGVTVGWCLLYLVIGYAISERMLGFSKSLSLGVVVPAALVSLMYVPRLYAVRSTSAKKNHNRSERQRIALAIGIWSCLAVALSGLVLKFLPWQVALGFATTSLIMGLLLSIMFRSPR